MDEVIHMTINFDMRLEGRFHKILCLCVSEHLNFMLFFLTEIMQDEIDQGVTPSDDAKELMLLAKSVLAKYWIIVCCAAFLLVALQSEVSLYQIFYMVIFLMGFVIYQVKKLM